MTRGWELWCPAQDPVAEHLAVGAALRDDRAKCGQMRMLEITGAVVASGFRGPGLHVLIDEPQSTVHADRVRVVRVMERPHAAVSAGSGKTDG
jgi:hypothetical protein